MPQAIRTLVLGCLATLLLLIRSEAAADVAAQLPPASQLSVVWIVLDAARATSFGVYGSPLGASPAIDRFAASATVFERAYCQVPWTLGSVASYLTGKYPWKREAGIEARQSLAHHLRAAGLRTAAFSENPYVTPQFGFDDGFEIFRAYFPSDVLAASPHDYPRIDSARTVDDALTWLEDVERERFFLYIHLLPPHAPYDPPAPFARRLDPDYEGTIQGHPKTLVDINKRRVRLEPRDLEHLRLQYHENLAYADHQVGRMLAEIERRGLMNRTIVVVASDHGEGFYEHGFLLHNYTLFDEVLHVPLIIRFPSSLGQVPKSWPFPVELRRVFATICDALGVRSCRRPDESLLIAIRDEPGQDRPVFAISERANGTPLKGLISGKHKLIGTGDRFEHLILYDLDADSQEKNDLAAQRPEVTRVLGKILRRTRLERVTLRDSPPIPDETRQRLKALGYGD